MSATGAAASASCRRDPKAPSLPCPTSRSTAGRGEPGLFLLRGVDPHDAIAALQRFAVDRRHLDVVGVVVESTLHGASGTGAARERERQQRARQSEKLVHANLLV